MTPYIPNEHAEALVRALKRVAKMKRIPKDELQASRAAITAVEEQMQSPVYVRVMLNQGGKQKDLASLMPAPAEKKK